MMGTTHERQHVQAPEVDREILHVAEGDAKIDHVLIRPESRKKLGKSGDQRKVGGSAREFLGRGKMNLTLKIGSIYHVMSSACIDMRAVGLNI
jgi:hypothetical protein